MIDDIEKEMPATGAGGITKVLQSHNNSSFVPNQANYGEDFRGAMRQDGIVCNGPIIADGKIYRFANNGKGKKNAWQVFFGMAGAFGDWSLGIREKWSIKEDHLTPQERKERKKQSELSKKASEKEKQKRHAEVAIEAQKQWEGLRGCLVSTIYAK
jgi:phage/plasmid primase-like uncharacterized protein